MNNHLYTYVVAMSRYSVMTDKCWSMDPDKRADFFQLRRALEDLVAVSKIHGKSFMDLELAILEQLQGD